MSDKVIVTDCDGVLLDWETAFHEWMTHCEYDIKKEGPKLTYHFEDTFDITREKGRELVREFNESAGIGFLEPFRDSVEGVKALVNEGYVFDVVTSLGKYGPAVALREMNLERVFGKECFREIVCLGLGEDKYDYLKERYENSGLFWIEDKFSNSIDGAKVGLKSILMEHDHNKWEKSSDYRIRRAKNWSEVVDIILKNANH